MIHRLYRFRILREEPSPLIAAMDEADGAQVWLAPIQFDPDRRAIQTEELVAIAESRKAENFTANGHFYLVASSEAEALDLLTDALACISIVDETKPEISDQDHIRKSDLEDTTEPQPAKSDRVRIFLLVALAAAAVLVVIFIIANSR
ncbi:hypothetical protein [Terracidiphilus gabretensis]|jgi:hypothetical protein|uniref:hypothetical protein n=1 Tax=Terracidiphilus gabretensis TaxID=1577687 RepID=UPI00071B75E1|nr:hypothetical protein [Terracidiphilus gabretensis]